MPKMTTTTCLLSHQQTAVEKLLPTRIGAAFMEMGTGKSRMAIELIARRQDRVSNVIWFCPVSLKETVRYEILKHTDTSPDDIHVFGAKTNERTVPTVFWYIVGIESMSASRRMILTVNAIIDEGSMVIVDESSYIKGHRSARTDWITRIAERARYRLILTGTPLSQGVVDLFAQMRFLSPKILGYRSFYSFAANHLEYSEKYPGLIVRSHNTAYLAAKIKPYVYQVTKEECLDLPDKLYHSEYFSMTREQRSAYEQAKEEILAELDDDKVDSYIIFRLFTALQQIVSGFWKRKTKLGSEFLEFDQNRTSLLMDIIRKIPKNEKIVIWSKFVHDIDKISATLREEYGDASTALFYGKLNEKHRRAEVVRFCESSKFFVATQSCGGYGLNELIQSAYAIFYANGFKHSERQQAEARSHRIGQTKPVTYIDIVCLDSIDVRISNALAAKGNVVEQFKSEVDRVKGKSRKDLIMSL